MLLDVLTEFIQELRAAGIPVSMVEAIDAAEALRHTDLADRGAFKASLGATLVKNERHHRAFDVAFEVFFADHRDLPGPDGEGDGAESPDRPDQANRSRSRDGRGRGGGAGGQADLEALRDALFRALRDADLAGLRELAGDAVDELAGIEPGRPVGGTYYLYRTLRQLGVDDLAARLEDELAAEGEGDLDERLAREEAARRVEALRSEVEAEIRRRLVADRGREAVAKTLRRPLLEDTDLMHATRADLSELEAAIRPLTRKLATRLAQRRKRRRDGRLDFRRTMRRSLATGGVPIEPVFRAPRVAKPELFLLCDISGSMATFSRFTLQFTYAMNAHFSKLRSFAFIDSLDEVTGLFGVGTDFAQALERISVEAEVVYLDGHSDYGRSLQQFWERYGPTLTPRSVVIVAGDARGNYRTPHADVLGAIRRSSRGVYWLNPEPRAYWDTGDSVMSAYATHCDGVFEVRTLRQLEGFIEQVALPRATVRT
jgi:uncharacterized protein